MGLILIREEDAMGDEFSSGMLYALSFPEVSLKRHHWRVSMGVDWSIAKTDFNTKRYQTRRNVGLTASVSYEF